MLFSPDGARFEPIRTRLSLRERGFPRSAMPPKSDPDATAGIKLLRLFRKLMLDGHRHFQRDLAEEFCCSAQTIIRLIAEVETVVGASLESGLENRRRWYRIRTLSRSRLGLDFEELRYLSVCRDLAAPLLPEPIRERVDDTIFSLSMLLADPGYARRDTIQNRQFAFFAKGRIDYTPHQAAIDALILAKEERRVCLVRYRAPGRTRDKELSFVPNQIVSMSNALYALGVTVTERSGEIRHLTNLAVHRIRHVAVTEDVLKDALPEADAGAFGLPWHEPRSFHIRFAPEVADYIRERVWADEQTLESCADGGLILSITTRSEPELTAWVRGFGEAATLLL